MTMTVITIGGEPLDLFSGFSMEIEDTSPIFNDAGPQTLSFSIPATLRNRRLLGFPERPDAVGNGGTRRPRCMVASGSYTRTGVINIGGASGAQISINIGFDNSIAYDEWRSRKLPELDRLPCLRFRDVRTLTSHMNAVYATADPRIHDVAVFPICLDIDSTDEKSDGSPDYWELLTPWALWFGEGDTIKMERLIDGELTKVTVPIGYGCTPFVRVWKILECVFADLGLKLDSNPFRDDDDLVRLVVLNNTADALCTGVLDYRELMPDCTVEEFLHALYVRFGMVYHTDFDTGTVCVRLMRDVAASPCAIDLDSFLASPPSCELRTPPYVRLAAGDSIEGAAPLTDRFDDFLQDFPLSSVFVGEAIDIWPGRYPIMGGFPDNTRSPAVAPATDPDAPEFVEIPRSEKPVAVGYHFSWDRLSGKWYRVSPLNGNRVMETSSSFFVWDPQPEGHEPLDLTSKDEWCPVAGTVVQSNQQSAAGHVVMPMFLIGARHFHSYIESADKEENGDCPLSFMFAVTAPFGQSTDTPVTFGRLSTGSSHLYFQFRGGLYDRYWRAFDHALRNADRTVSAVCMMSVTMLRAIDLLRPVCLQGVPMLIDTMTATLAGSRLVRVEMKLVPMMAAGESPSVPEFPPDGAVL